MMKESDIKRLTPKEIQDKFALPYLPNRIVGVTPLKDTRIRVGTANKNFSSNGGGKQFELLEKIDKSLFTNSRSL